MIKLIPEIGRIIAHPPGKHPDSPIKNSLWAVEAVNASVVKPGKSRWYGAERAWIGSDLRMHIEGGFANERNELCRKWDDCDC